MATDKDKLEKDLLSLAADLNRSIAQIAAHLAEIDSNDLEAHLDIFRIVYESESYIGNANKILGEMKRTLSYEVIPGIMEDKEISSIKFKGKNFVVGSRMDASIPLHMQTKGYEWLKSVGLDGVIKETANPKALSSVLGQYITETGITPPEDCVKIHYQDYIIMRKA